MVRVASARGTMAECHEEATGEPELDVYGAQHWDDRYWRAALAMPVHYCLAVIRQVAADQGEKGPQRSGIGRAQNARTSVSRQGSSPSPDDRRIARSLEFPHTCGHGGRLNPVEILPKGWWRSSQGCGHGPACQCETWERPTGRGRSTPAPPGGMPRKPSSNGDSPPRPPAGYSAASTCAVPDLTLRQGPGDEERHTLPACGWPRRGSRGSSTG